MLDRVDLHKMTHWVLRELFLVQSGPAMTSRTLTDLPDRHIRIITGGLYTRPMCKENERVMDVIIAGTKFTDSWILNGYVFCQMEEGEVFSNSVSEAAFTLQGNLVCPHFKSLVMELKLSGFLRGSYG